MPTVVLALRLLLATVFVVAGVGKLLDLPGSRRAMEDFGVPERAVALAGLVLPLAELAVAVALVFPASARWGALGALLLLLGFIGGIANALRQGEAPDCHCFGQIHSAPAGRETLVRNGVLAVGAAIVVVSGPGPSVSSWVSARTPAELVAVGVGVLAAVLASLAIQWRREARELRSDLSTAQRMVASGMPGIPVGSPAPGFTLHDPRRGEMVTLRSFLEQGRPVLLTFVGPSCPSCVELIPKLSHWQRTLAQQLTVVIVSSGDERVNGHFLVEHEIHNVLLQDRYEVLEGYRIRGTPSAVIVSPDGTLASNPAESIFGIEPLIRLALRSGIEAVAEQPLAAGAFDDQPAG